MTQIISDETFQQFLNAAREECPAAVEVLARLKPDTCYRFANEADGGKGHYMICAYAVDEDDQPVVSLEHGADSYVPGTQVFGVKPHMITTCGCGAWKRYP
jgi:hypothetical protein